MRQNKQVRLERKKTSYFLYLLLAAGMLVMLMLIPSSKVSAAGDSGTTDDLLRQWHKFKSECADTGRVAEFMQEGERIIKRLQELEDLRRSSKQAAGENFYQRIAKLQERFKYLLFQIEMARLSVLPPQEIEIMQARYLNERDNLLKDIKALEDSIIVRGELFLESYKQQIALKHQQSKQEMIVDFIYRLAEIYYGRAEEDFYATNDVKIFKPALEKYQRIIDEFPASEYVDDALYNIAYVKNSSQLPDDQVEAITLYKTLIEKYQNSPFVAESYWRVAEHYFYQRPPQTHEAIANYSQLLEYPQTSWYARSLYKIGWCHFLDGDYPSAIEHFTLTVESSLDQATEPADVIFASMKDEATQYISVCFAQDQSEWEGSGVDAALTFVTANSLRRETYGKRIIEYLGDIYQYQVGNYPLAIEAYEAYLDLYPYDSKSPWVQERIINCYAINLRDFGQAYNEKDRLFATYRAGTDWDQANPDEQLRADADVIIEKYYFQNINESIGRALDTQDNVLLTSSVGMSRNYLEAFPQGPNAYTVNYNLAIILDQHLTNNNSAYTEYLKVAQTYPDDKHRKEAAVNAVVVAQRMVSAEGEKPIEELQGAELSEAEVKYVGAVDNYLDLFPGGEEAELFLLNAGSVYYNHGDYANSRIYYDRLLTDFPEGERRADAYRYVMNGYFSEGEYGDAERIAKEIQIAGFDSSLVATAKTRQAESVFLSAQGLKSGGDVLAAAEEYKRAALETPGYGQADKALFESGLAYQQADAYSEANEVYLLLVENYPESGLADKALYNVGYNCQSEMNDQQTAARTFEKLSSQYPESKLAQDALRNASINYVEAEDWTSAIRVNRTYVSVYPAAADASVYLFDNAGLFLKMGDEESAGAVYDAYANKYPNDPRAVRARWERGQYLKDQGNTAEALGQFTLGIETHRSLVASGGEGEETYASRCLSEVINSEFEVYQAIEFSPASAIERQKELKLAKRENLLALCEEMNSLAKDEMFEGLYTVGKVEEELSLAFSEQALPDKGRAEEGILTRETANQDAIEISGRAIEAFIKAAEDIDLAIVVLKTKKAELEEHKSGLSTWVSAAQKADSIPQPTLPDSTAMLASIDRSLEGILSATEGGSDWGRRAREKVAELATRNAEIKFSTVRAFLDLPDVGKTEDLRMLYRSGVLSEFASPRGAGVIQLYRDAVNYSVYSENAGEWTTKAIDGVGQVFEVLNAEYSALNERALNAYSQNYITYQDLLGQGEGATTSKGLEAADIAERLVLYSDYSYEFAIGALTTQDKQLLVASEGEEIPAEIISRYTAAAIEEMFLTNERYLGLVAEAVESKIAAEELEEESVLWEDAVMTFEDCAYNFGEHQGELLNLAMEFNQIHGNDRTMALRIGWALVDLDREANLSLLADYGTEMWIKSDAEFVVNQEFTLGWEALEFDTDGWSSPLTTTYVGEADSELEGCDFLWAATEYDSLVCDSLYLRRDFEVENEPVAGDLWISVDGGYALLINGEYVGAAETGEGWSEIAHYDVSQVLVKGPNAVTVMAVDPDSTSGGVALSLRYKVLPTKPSGGP
ncbi:hypothetical protein CEE37_00555 [candidate division LCP-89 bacterium B3_LCP]|uniref:Outer membrane lipoprotein BamD-like domain-containing protein n=1 Tax=candidate division LCP-89 bacterium B3_LCP TaxID=2012998 RepID=A0A532V4S6_UNCL8|nr:MAG: hypothetical protein CEE37_00555 [candidate division LCP-89 bacterium B3_LCP]